MRVKWFAMIQFEASSSPSKGHVAGRNPAANAISTNFFTASGGQTDRLYIAKSGLRCDRKYIIGKMESVWFFTYINF